MHLWTECKIFEYLNLQLYRGADKSLARPGRKQVNVSVRMAWTSFDALPCKKKTWWQLASRCCWNHARPWHASEPVSFLVGDRAKDLTAPRYKLTTVLLWSNCFNWRRENLLSNEQTMEGFWKFLWIMYYVRNSRNLKTRTHPPTCPWKKLHFTY